MPGDDRVTVLRKRAVLAGEQKQRFEAASEEHKQAESELMEAVLAVAPALASVCSAIRLGNQASIWRGVEIGSRSYAKSDSAAVNTHRLYLDPQKRLLLVRSDAGSEPTIAPITALQAVMEFEVGKMIEALADAVERQLRGRTGDRTRELHERTLAVRGIAALLRTSKLMGKV